MAERRIYIASKTKHGPRWKALRAAGHPIISTWIDECGVGETEDWADLWDRCIREAASATLFVMYVEPGEVHKGSMVELGAALHAGVPVAWVGPAVGTVRRAKGITAYPSVEAAIGMNEVSASWMSFATDAMLSAHREHMSMRDWKEHEVVPVVRGGASGRAVVPVGTQCAHPQGSQVMPVTKVVRGPDGETASLLPRTSVQFRRAHPQSTVTTHTMCGCY